MAGGVVRDLILKKEMRDIDLTVSSRCLEFSEEFSKIVNGTYVLLDKETKASRVVIAHHNLDFTEFRGKDIREDLSRRDFSINAIAISFSDVMENRVLTLLDPFRGVRDIDCGLIRALSEKNITDDPLRMLRAYRLAATYNFRIDEDTEKYIRWNVGRLAEISEERITTELNRIFSVDRCYPWIERMAKTGLLAYIFPEMDDTRGVIQDGAHHLDVYGHSLLTLKYLEDVLNNPQEYFKTYLDSILVYVRSTKVKVLLKWAALFHDLGKPSVKQINPQGKITFYHHERIGSDTFLRMAQRLKLSKADTHFIKKIIFLHMRPLHIMRPFIQSVLTPKGIRRFIRQADGDLIGIFTVAMADSLAGEGPLKPLDAEERLANLFDVVYGYFKQRYEPIKIHPRLVTGKDLIEELHLAPGPVFGNLLREVEDAYMDGVVSTREEAIEWLRAKMKGT